MAASISPAFCMRCCHSFRDRLIPFLVGQQFPSLSLKKWRREMLTLPLNQSTSTLLLGFSLILNSNPFFSIIIMPLIPHLLKLQLLHDRIQRLQQAASQRHQHAALQQQLSLQAELQTLQAKGNERGQYYLKLLEEGRTREKEWQEQIKGMEARADELRRQIEEAKQERRMQEEEGRRRVQMEKVEHEKEMQSVKIYYEQQLFVLKKKK